MKSYRLPNRILTLVFFFVHFILSVNAQTPRIEKLRLDISTHTAEDTFRVNRLNALAFELRNKIPREAIEINKEALAISQKINYPIGEATSLMSLGFIYRFAGELANAIPPTQAAIDKFSELKDSINVIAATYNMGYIYSFLNDMPRAFGYSFGALKLAEQINNTRWRILCHTLLGNLFLRIETDKARQHLKAALQLADSVRDEDGISHCLGGLGQIAEKDNKPDEARAYYTRKIIIAQKNRDLDNMFQGQLAILEMDSHGRNYDSLVKALTAEELLISDKKFTGLLPWVTRLLSTTYLAAGKPDSAIKYGMMCLTAPVNTSTRSNVKNINKILGDAYFLKGDFKRAYAFQKTYLNFRDSLHENESVRNIVAIEYTYDLEKKQSEIDLLKKNEELIKETNSQQKKLLWGTSGGILLLGAMLFLLWRNNIERKKTNIKLQQQQDELKATQSQLIQSEKMASLGELTAGIAHEIQNPLNFVNNFSDVNNELLDEMRTELKNGNENEAMAIAEDIKQNLEKISHHGRRADAIVKGMLQHSRSSGGNKESTDLNALAEEYVRLAYHGYRSKDKSFNVTMKTDFGNDVGRINIVPQELGRVILNLLNNAFYAVNEKKKHADTNYEPVVQINTRRTNNKIEISVKDNGIGIPNNIIVKIFQPFFTTKPTGSGTGLGLSLAYDIVKAHGGEMKVHSVAGEGTEFIVVI